MTRLGSTTLITAGVMFAGLLPLAAQSKPPQPAPAGGAQRVAACKLLPTAEVKKHLPWRPQLDQFPPEEEAIGIHNNLNRFAELYVKTGAYLMTLQSNWDGKDPSVKAGTLSLAKALLPKLR